MTHLRLATLSLLAVLLGLASCTSEIDVFGSSQMGYFNTDGGIDPSAPGDQYNPIAENPFVEVSAAPISTFSIDADGASYANVRRYLQQDRQLPPADAVRTEEFINYFNLDYPFVDQGHPLSVNGEVAACPWNDATRLIRIGLKGAPLPAANTLASNLVFLVDVSGSMQGEDRLEIIKRGLIDYTSRLTDADRVAIVTYAGSAGVVLPSTSGRDKAKITDAIRGLGAGGSTAGAAGIITAYEIAEANLIPGGNNRVILATDGDFNVGPSSQEELVKLIEEKREGGVFLTALGVGRGNYNDAALEQIANHGNGTFEYLDKPDQLRKVFEYERARFFTVAKDVKIQVAFDSTVVKAYRLIGYENRLLKTEDFTDDKKDAGELGADQSVTALYEVKLVPGYRPGSGTEGAKAFTVDLRYKRPTATESEPLSLRVYDRGTSFAAASDELRLVAGTAGFAMLLRESPYLGTTTHARVREWLRAAAVADPYGYKGELVELVTAAEGLR